MGSVNWEYWILPVYFKIKKMTLITLSALLTLRFFFLIGDPRVFHLDMDQGLPLYSQMTGLIDVTYLITNLVLIPVNGLFDLIFLMIPAFHTAYFPALPASELTRYPGVFDWLALFSIGLVWLISPAMDQAYALSRNTLWKMFVEMSFAGKKHAIYQDTLKKRAKDLMKLNVEYRNLSKETSQLKDTVITDELTQIYNRRFFHQKMEELFLRAKQNKTPLSVIMMDIDYFKNINDKYGHLMGDTILRDIAMAIQKTTPSNAFLTRFGGEEFAMILPGHKIEKITAVTRTVQKGVASLTFEGAPELEVTISQGVAHLDFADELANALDEFNDFVRFADDELYRAKLAGRNTICLNHLKAAKDQVNT